MHATDTAYPLPDHFRVLDAVRGLAALAVVVFHYHHFYLADYTSRPQIPDVSAFPYSEIAAWAYLHGGAAVELFWVISGFVFVHVYLARPIQPWRFAVARFARLYPLHFATLLGVAGLQMISLAWVGHWQIYGNNDLRHFALQLGFSSNWSSLDRGLSFNGPIWSVSLEMVAYALFLITLPLLKRFGLIFAGLFCAAMWAMTQAHSLDLPLVRLKVFECAGYFYLGCCSWYVMRATRALPLLGVALAGAGIVASQIWGHTTLLIASASVAIVLAVTWGERRLRPPPIAWLSRLGDMSYSIYLVHVPLQMLLLLICDGFFDGTRAFAHSHWTLPAYLLVTLILADLTYRRFEAPAGRWLRKTLS